MVPIEIRDVTLVYDTPAGKVPGVKDVNFNIGASEFVCIVGPSGCGKSTLLNIIAGFLAPASGEIRIGGKPVTDSCRADPRLWVECVVGATLEEGLFLLLRAAGFTDVELLRRLDYFASSPSADTREIAAALHAQAIVVTATRP